MNRIRNVFKLFLPVFCLLAGSCGYQLGGTKPPKLELAQTVKVCLFANNSLEPRAATLVTGALADELQRDGTYRLSSGADADIRVEGEVYSITFDQLRSSREDTYKSTELGLRLSVKYRVVDARTQEILYAGSAEEVGQFFDQGNIQSARTNALSYAARLVATSIAETLPMADSARFRKICAYGESEIQRLFCSGADRQPGGHHPAGAGRAAQGGCHCV